ncbi:hypothetical protein B0H14DRAFT_1467014 [Mycena olivaceomarginata]|nr:hypothetical protein B0H14DRAFT_1467014 [Mycena olivaceomarginata]
MPRTTLIVHGVRDTEQADELWILVDQLKDKLKTRFKSLGIVIVSEPALLRHNSEDDRLILDYFCTMHVSEKFVLYSGVSPTPPVLCENLFQLFADGVHRIGGSKAERLWPKVLKLSPDDDSNPGELENSTTAILAKLHKAAEGRKQLLECLPDIYFIKRSHILKQQAQDNIKIAHRLEPVVRIELQERNRRCSSGTCHLGSKSDPFDSGRCFAQERCHQRRSTVFSSRASSSQSTRRTA